jgi:hypothetical protein
MLLRVKVGAAEFPCPILIDDEAHTSTFQSE